MFGAVLGNGYLLHPLPLVATFQRFLICITYVSGFDNLVSQVTKLNFVDTIQSTPREATKELCHPFNK